MRRAYAIRRSRAADWARLCGGLAVPVLILTALGMRAGLVPRLALLPLLIVGFVLALLAWGIAIYALTDIWKNGAAGGRAAVSGMVYSLPVLALLGVIAAAAIHYPRLTDVTTNAQDPPEFVAGTDLGAAFPRDRAALMEAAYPNLVTRVYPLQLGEVYSATHDLIEERGWTLVRDSRPTIMPEAKPDSEAPQIGETEELMAALAGKSTMTQSRRGAAPPPGGEDGAEAGSQAGGPGNVATLEATARTLVFGFEDMVVVRLRGSPEGTEVDVRSASRIGEHDLGQNARRIESFFKQLDAALQPDGSAAGIASAGR